MNDENLAEKLREAIRDIGANSINIMHYCDQYSEKIIEEYVDVEDIINELDRLAGDLLDIDFDIWRLKEGKNE